MEPRRLSRCVEILAQPYRCAPDAAVRRYTNTTYSSFFNYQTVKRKDRAKK